MQAALELGAIDLQQASDTSTIGHVDVPTALKTVDLRLSHEHLAFVRENFHVDHCGFLVRPCTDMLKILHDFGYIVIVIVIVIPKRCRVSNTEEQVPAF